MPKVITVGILVQVDIDLLVWRIDQIITRIKIIEGVSCVSVLHLPGLHAATRTELSKLAHWITNCVDFDNYCCRIITITIILYHFIVKL